MVAVPAEGECRARQKYTYTRPAMRAKHMSITHVGKKENYPNSTRRPEPLGFSSSFLSFSLSLPLRVCLDSCHNRISAHCPGSEPLLLSPHIKHV